jgi:hypothetical protein
MNKLNTVRFNLGEKIIKAFEVMIKWKLLYRRDGF